VRRSLGEGGPPLDKATAGKPAGWQYVLRVYLLVSIGHPNQHYIGLTRDLKKRLKDHNEGRSKHTFKFAPWKLAAYFAFADEKMAGAFEQYLKSGSGKAFLKRHLLPQLVRPKGLRDAN
jgi:predicted GIY-YIG superfamily endonuclease